MSGVGEEYEKKLISPEGAVDLIKDGDHVVLGGSVNFAQIIDKHLAERKDRFSHLEVSTFIDVLPYEFLRADPTQTVFKWSSGFLHLSVRCLSRELGSCMYFPNLFYDAPRITREVWDKKIDIAFLPVTAMDKKGYFNFGLTCAHMKALAKSAKKVVAVVKEDMPWIYGGYDEVIHISEVDYVVEDKEFPTFSVPFMPIPGKEEEMIAENIIEAGLIQNGSTLQVGIGPLPDAVVSLLRKCDYKELGVHTEMIADGVMSLIEEGIITNSQKKIDIGKSVFTFSIGTRKLYDYLERNPEVAIYPVDYTNDPFIIAQQPKMFSLNSAMQIDLMGQVNSEQLGLLSPSGKVFQVSGTGGQLDFVIGCLFSKDRQGKSVLSLYSTYNGTSRIVPLLLAGSAVTVPRTMVQYVATEWGVVYLRGLPIRERAFSLISIAHPDHREWLAKEAERVGIFPPNYTLPARKPMGLIVSRE